MNSPFASALAEYISKPELQIETAFKRVSEAVYSSTQRKQLPWHTSAIHGDHYLGITSDTRVVERQAHQNRTTTPTQTSQITPTRGPDGRNTPAEPKPASGTLISPSDRVYARISYFIQWRFFGADNGAHKLGPESFDERVDYYGRASVPREQVIKEKEAYYKRWPNRRFYMEPDTLRIIETSPGLYDVTFDFKFDVENNKRRSVGLSKMSLGLRALNRDFALRWQDEKIQNREITTVPPK